MAANKRMKREIDWKTVYDRLKTSDVKTRNEIVNHLSNENEQLSKLISDYLSKDKEMRYVDIKWFEDVIRMAAQKYPLKEDILIPFENEIVACSEMYGWNDFEKIGYFRHKLISSASWILGDPHAYIWSTIIAYLLYLDYKGEKFNYDPHVIAILEYVVQQPIFQLKKTLRSFLYFILTLNEACPFLSEKLATSIFSSFH